MTWLTLVTVLIFCQMQAFLGAVEAAKVKRGPRPRIVTISKAEAWNRIYQRRHRVTHTEHRSLVRLATARTRPHVAARP